jgi:hypothetical protein
MMAHGQGVRAMGSVQVKNRMLMLSGAMILAFAVNGVASAATQVLDCYRPNGQAVACMADYAIDEAAPSAGHIFHLNDNPPAVPTGEEIMVIGDAPELDVSLANPNATTSSGRPGLVGDWIPVVGTDPLDKLQRWEAAFLGGEGLLAGWQF